MSTLAVKTIHHTLRHESKPLMRDTPSILTRICACVCRIMAREQNESFENNLTHRTSYLQRLADFNTYSGYPCEIDYNARSLWNAELNQHPVTYRPLRRQSFEWRSYTPRG